MMVFDRNTGATVWTKPGIPFEPPIVHESKVFTFCQRDIYYPPGNDSLMGLYGFDVTTGSVLWKRHMRIEYGGTNPFISGNMLFHSGIMKDAATTPEKGYLKAFDFATGNEIWNVPTGLTYEQICRHLTCVGNSVYAFKYPAPIGGPGLYARIVRYDYSTGQTKDSISIPGESFGKMFLLASDGKIYFPG
jgi:outer membrane protein assembly factor BamB